MRVRWACNRAVGTVITCWGVRVTHRHCHYYVGCVASTVTIGWLVCVTDVTVVTSQCVWSVVIAVGVTCHD